MTTSKRVLFCAWIVALAIAMMPLWGRTSALPCQFMWRYAISYGPPGAHIIVPEDGFPRLRPLCADVWRMPGAVL